MKFRAIEITTLPLIVWQDWDGATDGLVIEAETPPTPQFGVCPLKIVGGALEARTAPEMAAFENDYNAKQSLNAFRSKASALESASFTWGDWDFPMFEAARLFYAAVQALPAANIKAKDVTGTIRDVLEADVPAFLNAYYNALKTQTQP